MPKSDLESFVQQYGKVKRLAKRLHEGEVVQLRDIAAVLGKQAITDFKSEWQSETNYRQAFKSKPAVVVAYEAKLKLADMMYGRAEKLSGLRGNTSKAAQNAKIKNMYDKAEKYYETALELLAENYEQDASLGMYFDRNFDFTEGNEPGPTLRAYRVPKHPAASTTDMYNIARRATEQLPQLWQIPEKQTLKQQ